MKNTNIQKKVRDCYDKTPDQTQDGAGKDIYVG